VTPCSLADGYRSLDETAASTFREEELEAEDCSCERDMHVK
jgi:hypothetical protein